MTDIWIHFDIDFFLLLYLAKNKLRTENCALITFAIIIEQLGATNNYHRN